MKTYVKGWAFEAPEVHEAFDQDFFAALDTLGIPRPDRDEDGDTILSPEFFKSLSALIVPHSRVDGYNKFTVVLDEACSRLTYRQKLLIADQGNACFGGTANGLTVTIYTD